MVPQEILANEEAYYTEAFSRNIGLVSKDEQEKFKNTTVAIAGLGGVGGIFTLSLARLGIGSFHISDPDTFSPVNINRQIAAFTSTFDKPKAETIERMIKEINPFAKVIIFPEAKTEDEMVPLLTGASVVLDGIDFYVQDARRALFTKAQKMGIPVLTAGPIGFGSCLLHFDPKGMSFDDYFDMRDDMSLEERAVHFGLGVTPLGVQSAYMKLSKDVNFKERKAPSTVIGTLAAANLVTCEVVKILLGRGEVTRIPRTTHFDPYVQKYKKSNYRWGNRSPIQRLKLWYVKRLLGIGQKK